MSMLSSQADELRLMARLVRDYDYKEISRMLREAADTIISLRDRLQDAELGRGTCHNTSHHLDESRFHCSECGFGCWVKDVSDGRDKLPSYCPRCGAEVER